MVNRKRDCESDGLSRHTLGTHMATLDGKLESSDA